MRCSSCQTVNSEDAKYCVECSASLAIRCPKCQLANPVSARFCSNCATLLAESDSRVRVVEGERRHVTVLFCDIVSSTEIATRLDPEEWHAVAAQYQRMSAEAVSRIGGHIGKYLGDGLIAYFGYPQAQEDAAERAVRAGLAILDTMNGLNARFADEHKIKLQVRVGIHTGTVVVAEGGGSEADMFGDAPNIASRVQTAAEPDTVVITSAVHDIVSGLFSVEDRGAQRLKGIEQPTRLYRVLSPGLAGSRSRVLTERALSPFVGRENETKILLARWSDVRNGQGQLVLATGEPGIGKTRFVTAFKTRIKSDAHLWLECFGAPLFASTPFYAVIQMLDQGLAWRGDESPQERVARLQQALERADVDRGEAVPLIAELLNLPVPPDYAERRIPADQRRERLFRALAAWVFSVARNQPLVIVVEDLQWVDPSTMELLQTLATEGAGTQLLLLCTARPEFRAPWPAQSHHTSLTLNRLDTDETRELIQAVVARAGLAQNVIDAVIKRTDGVPLFAEELTRLMLESAGGLGEHQIPETLQDSLAARLDRLGRAKEIAQLGAVLGREFSYQLLAAISPMHEDELRRGLAQLVDAQLIYASGSPPEASYQFKHALIQDAAYEALLKSKRRTLHAEIAQTLESRFSDVVRSQPGMLAHHYSEAREPEKALMWWRNAGRQSIQATAYAEALDQLNRALAQLELLPESPERDSLETKIRIELSTPLVGIGGYTSDALRANTERSVELFQRTRAEALFPALAGQLSLAYGSSHMIRAVTIGEQLYESAEKIGDRGLRVLASWLLGMALTGRGRLGDALAILERGLSLSEAEADRALADQYSSDPRIASLAYQALVLQQLGFPDQAESVDTMSVASAVQGGHSATIGLALTLRVCLQLLRNDHAALARAATELRDLAQRQSSQPLQAVSGAILALLAAERAPDERHFAQARQTIEAIRQVGWNLMVGWLSLLEAKVSLQHGRIAEARDTLSALREVIEPRGHDFFLPELYRLRAEVAARQGATDEAVEGELRHAIELSRRQGARLAELRCGTDLACLWRGQGRRSEAKAMLAPLCAWFGEGAETADLVRARGVFASL
jgi:class 3 adenylate cyclase